jgi:hypothetical protein
MPAARQIEPLEVQLYRRFSADFSWTIFRSTVLWAVSHFASLCLACPFQLVVKEIISLHSLGGL